MSQAVFSPELNPAGSICIDLRGRADRIIALPTELFRSTAMHRRKSRSESLGAAGRSLAHLQVFQHQPCSGVAFTPANGLRHMQCMGIANFLETRCFRFEHGQACGIVQFDEKLPTVTFDALSLIYATAAN